MLHVPPNWYSVKTAIWLASRELPKMRYKQDIVTGKEMVTSPGADTDVNLIELYQATEVNKELTATVMNSHWKKFL